MFFFFSSRRRHTRWNCDWSSDVCSSDLDRPDSTALLPQIRVPTLVLGGADDEIAPPAGMQALAAAIPGSQFATVPSAGHLAPLEQPLATSRRLADFLGALAGPTVPRAGPVAFVH